MKLQVLFKNKNGYAFPLVLMIVTIISLLGVSILGLAMANFKLQVADSEEKKDFYLTEAGLDETYALMQNEICSMINAAKEDAQTKVKQAINEELASDDPLYIYTNTNGSINQGKVDSELKRIFKEDYKKEANDNLKQNLDDMSKYKGISGGVNLYFYQPDDNSWLYNESNLSDESNNFYKLRVTSKLGEEKEVSTVFKIKVPNYGTAYVKDDLKSVDRNVLWLRPITAEGKISVTSNNVTINNVTINGDVFAYNGADISYGSNTTINGSFYSFGDIEKKASTADSKLEISNGNVYCSTLRLIGPEESNGKNNVTINGNVFTKDDIELNGYKSNVSIDGSYYGFSDGSDRDSLSGGIFTKDAADKSSCIIVNTDDIGKSDGSYLSITGRDYTNNDILDMSKKVLHSGIIIAGTAYVNPNDTENMYQTGESVSIKGNYKAYLQPLWGLSPINGQDYNASNIVFDLFGELQLANKFKVFKGPDANQSNYLLLPIQRYYYLQQADNLYHSVVKNGIELNNMLQTAGAWVGSTADTAIHYTPGDTDTQLYYTNAAKDFKYYVNKLGDPNSKYNNYRSFTEDELRSRVYIRDGREHEGRFNFSYSEDSFNSGELTYISGDTRPLVIIGPGGKAEDIPADVSNKNPIKKNASSSDMKGIVITGGSVYFLGNLNYTGILVSEGDIGFVDSYAKNISYNKKYLIKRLAENDKLKGSFINNADKTDTINVSPSVDFPDISTKVAINNLISINDWNKVK